MHLDPHIFEISWAMVAEKALRSFVVYAFLIVVLRLAGKRELAQLNPFDFVIFLTLSNAVQNAIIGNDDSSLVGGLVGASALMAVNYVANAIRVRANNPWLDNLVEGCEDVLISDGKIDRRQLRREEMTEEDLLGAARKQGSRTLEEIDFAALEPGGGIYFEPKQPSTYEKHFKELTSRLDEISAELRELTRS